MAIRILLADDHVLFRRGLRRILEEQVDFEIVAETGSGLEAVELAGRLQPDVAVIDIAMKEMNGVEATRQILSRSSHTAVMILSMHSDERYVMQSLKAGARSYVLKDAVEEGLIHAVRQIHAGEAYFSPQVAGILAQRFESGAAFRQVDGRYELLTGRERQIYHLLAEGNSSKEIASRLSISLHTAETHRTRIMEKLGLHSIAELVLNAVRRGVVS